MGARLSFIAFKAQPDLQTLASIEWLTAYRLFKRKAANEWYLEGQSPEPEKVDLSETLGVDAGHGSPARDAYNRAVSDLAAALADRNLSTSSLDDEGLVQALFLSEELSTATLLAYANDEGADAGFICQQGKLRRARILIGSDTAIEFTSGSLRIERLDDSEHGPVLYRIANEVAAEFFGWNEGQRVSSDPGELDAEKPQYRRKLNFHATRRRLSRRWRIVKLRISIDGWLRR